MSQNLPSTCDRDQVHVFTWILYHFRDEYESVVHSNDNIAPVGYLNFKKIHVQYKNVSEIYCLVILKNPFSEPADN